MADIDRLEERISQLEIHIRTLNLAKRLLETERTQGCTNGCTGACPDPTGNCTYGCTNGCTNGCTGSCTEAVDIDIESLSQLFVAEGVRPSPGVIDEPPNESRGSGDRGPERK